MNTLRLSYADEAELDGKLKAIMHRRGFVVAPAAPERITVGELARRLGRNISNVSTQLRSKHCPPFESGMGKRRIVWLIPNDRLLSFLRNATPGQRNDLK